MTMTAEPTAQSLSPVPAGFHTVSVSLVIQGAASAIEFYEKALGAVEIDRASSPDGTKIMHATIKIGDSYVMLNDEFPEWENFGPKKFGGSPASMHLYVENADAAFERAVAAGCTVTMPLSDAFWGDRYGRVVDPFGYDWAFASRQRIATEADINAALAGMDGGCGAQVTE
jgi:PhnB protein